MVFFLIYRDLRLSPMDSFKANNFYFSNYQRAEKCYICVVTIAKLIVINLFIYYVFTIQQRKSNQRRNYTITVNTYRHMYDFLNMHHISEVLNLLEPIRTNSSKVQ